MILAKRSSFKKAQKKNFIRRPQPLPPLPTPREYDDNSEDPIYGNQITVNQGYMHHHDEGDEIYQNHMPAVPGWIWKTNMKYVFTSVKNDGNESDFFFLKFQNIRIWMANSPKHGGFVWASCASEKKIQVTDSLDKECQRNI